MHLIKILWCSLTLPAPGWSVCAPVYLPSVTEGRKLNALHGVNSGIIHFVNAS